MSEFKNFTAERKVRICLGAAVFFLNARRGRVAVLLIWGPMIPDFPVFVNAQGGKQACESFDVVVLRSHDTMGCVCIAKRQGIAQKSVLQMLPIVGALVVDRFVE